MRIIGRLEAVPGGLVLTALLTGTLLRTFAPAVLDAGGYVTAMASGTEVYMGVLLFCTGVMIDLRHGPRLLRRGAVMVGAKILLGMVLGYLAVRFGPVLGLSGIAVTAALTNTNGSLGLALINRYGDPEDVAALALRLVGTGPLITLLVLGVAGQVDSLARSIVVTVAPLLLGMLLGTFDRDAIDLFAPVVRGIVPLSMFAVGSRIDLATAITAGLAGFLLAGLVLATGCLVGIWADRRTGGQGIAGATLGTTAGNAVLTPAAVAAFVPAASPLVAAASAQIATACIVTSLVIPFVIARLQKQFPAPLAPAPLSELRDSSG